MNYVIQWQRKDNLCPWMDGPRYESLKDAIQALRAHRLAVGDKWYRLILRQDVVLVQPGEDVP